MLSKSVHVLCFLTVFIPIRVQGDDICLSDLTEQPTYNTDSPIHIKLSNEELMENSSPVSLTNNNTGTLKLQNKGNIIEGDFIKTDNSFISGGILCSKRYLLSKFRIYVNPNKDERSGHTINGTSYPVEFTLIYYDSKKYNSFNDAIGNIAATVQVAITVEVLRNSEKGNNPSFDGLADVFDFEDLQNPGSSKIIVNEEVFSLFDVSKTRDASTIAYIGSYYHVSEKKLSPGTICFVLSEPTFISEDQFSAFESVQGDDGNQLKTIAPIFEQGKNRPIYEEPPFTLMED